MGHLKQVLKELTNNQAQPYSLRQPQSSITLSGISCLQEEDGDGGQEVSNVELQQDGWPELLLKAGQHGGDCCPPDSVANLYCA